MADVEVVPARMALKGTRKRAKRRWP